MGHKPLIAITMGDPAGIGPELCLRALAERSVCERCMPVVYGDVAHLRRVSEATGIAWPDIEVFALDVWRKGTDPAARREGTDPVGPEGTDPVGPAIVDWADREAGQIVPGQVQAVCGRLAYGWITQAIQDALAGRVAAMVTAPIHKQALRAAGVRHPGHTEILAEQTGASRVCMMLANEEIAVSLATIHMLLADVPQRLNSADILSAIELSCAAMRCRGRATPRIGVLALNPHGGEHGLFGDEEQRIIEPAIAAARARGIEVEGPLVPDTAFLPAVRARIDVYVAMYHDQGLIPLKMLAFEDAVNVTLGLPIVRTSVDHGTAFDLAWQGLASPGSLYAAIRWACELAERTPA